jgi:hypothetical protein
MKRIQKIIPLFSALFALTFLISACSAFGSGSQNAAGTAAAQTVAAVETQTAVAQLESDATQLAQTETAQAMPTNTPMPTPTPTLTPNPIDEGEGNVCNFAGFIEDVTIEDRTVMEPNATFTKVWRLKNLGECEWTTGYQVVFVSGYQMDAPVDSLLPENVAPGQEVDISLNMVAPNSPGSYTGYWELESDQGEVFGVGQDGKVPFWVRIQVTENEKNVIYNFAENACQAGWESSVDSNISCPSSENTTKGFIQPLDKAELEDSVTYNEPAILTYPDAGESGFMVGAYPSIKIQNGDHFQATIGCQYGAPDCNVSYTLRVITSGEKYDLLGQWHEVYEGLYYPVDVDLSNYAGQEVQVVLSVIAEDDASQNYAIWLNPQIVREAN